jgi:hypothetical protein
MATGRRRQLVIGSDAVDPGIDFVGIDIDACIEFSTRLGYALSLPEAAALSLVLGLPVRCAIVVVRTGDRVHAS